MDLNQAVIAAAAARSDAHPPPETGRQCARPSDAALMSRAYTLGSTYLRRLPGGNLAGSRHRGHGSSPRSGRWPGSCQHTRTSDASRSTCPATLEFWASLNPIGRCGWHPLVGHSGLSVEIGGGELVTVGRSLLSLPVYVHRRATRTRTGSPPTRRWRLERSTVVHGACTGAGLGTQRTIKQIAYLELKRRSRCRSPG